MSIPKPDSKSFFDVPGDDSAHTCLITKLVGELFSEYQSTGSQRPASPSTPRTDVGADTTGLAGAYPRNNHPDTPSVHPAAQSVAGNSTPASGAYEQTSNESYQFGEPKLESEAQTSVNQPGLTSVNSGEESGIQDFYFIGKPQTEKSGFGNLSTSSPLSAFDVQSVRRDFPALHQQVNGKQLVWLDNAATTHKPQSVLDATSQFYGRDNSNIHRAAHALAARATDLYEKGREKVRQFIGAADAKEIVFVRGTTEAINLVAQTYGRDNIGAGDEIILTTMEHHANIVPWQMLAKQTGAIIRVAPINDKGELILEQFAALFNSKTKIVSVTQVANALGTINPIEQITAISHSHGVPVLVDGAQSTPHMPVNVQALNADFFVFSGHKIFAPTGIGVLYGKSALLESMSPWQGGGNMIKDVTFTKTTYEGFPQKFEAGTQNIAGVAGLTAAIDYMHNLGLPSIAAYEHDLLVYATEKLEKIPGLKMIGTAAAKASVLSFVLNGFKTEEVGKYLDQNGIAVRSGHHCAQPSLRRFGLESTVRPSLAFYNTHAEIDYLVNVLRKLPVKK